MQGKTLDVRDLRQSEIKDLERCPMRWHWGWNEQLTPTRTNTKLWMGIGVHEALAQWYQKGTARGIHPAEFWQTWCDAQGSGEKDRAVPEWESEDVTYHDVVELGTYMLEQYIETYGNDEQWSFIATEQTFRMHLLTPKEYRRRIARKHIARLVGTWDGVYRDLATGEVWLAEHKTSAVGGVPRFIKMLPIDKQTNTYYMSATHLLRQQGLLKPNENIAGIMFNWLEKHKPSETTSDKMAPDGVVRNKPSKANYFAALKDEPDLDLELTKLPSLTALADLAAARNIVVYGDPSKVQPRTAASYFTREAAFRSNGDLHHVYHELAATGVQRENYLLGITPLTKNPTMDCSWDCNFFKLCQLHSAGEDWEEYKDLAFTTKEDRYADHNNQKKA